MGVVVSQQLKGHRVIRGIIDSSVDKLQLPANFESCILTQSRVGSRCFSLVLQNCKNKSQFQLESLGCGYNQIIRHSQCSSVLYSRDLELDCNTLFTTSQASSLLAAATLPLLKSAGGEQADGDGK